MSHKIYPAAIQSMFVEGGDIHGEVKKWRRDVLFATRRAAPRRSGDLKRSIRADRVGTNRYRNNFRVKAFAPHAKWVNDGTGPIVGGKRVRLGGRTKRRAERMVLYSIKPYGPRAGVPARYRKTVGARKRWVRGQRGSHYLERGLAEGLAKNGLL